MGATRVSPVAQMLQSTPRGWPSSSRTKAPESPSAAKGRPVCTVCTTTCPCKKNDRDLDIGNWRDWMPVMTPNVHPLAAPCLLTNAPRRGWASVSVSLIGGNEHGNPNSGSNEPTAQSIYTVFAPSATFPALPYNERPIIRPGLPSSISRTSCPSRAPFPNSM